MPRWPHAFQNIAGLIGDDAAIKLCSSYGGCECYVPMRLTPELRLVAEIGAEAAEVLIREYGGSKIHPPLLKEESLKAAIADATGSLTEIAKRFRVTRRWVSRVKTGKI